MRWKLYRDCDGIYGTAMGWGEVFFYIIEGVLITGFHCFVNQGEKESPRFAPLFLLFLLACTAVVGGRNPYTMPFTPALSQYLVVAEHGEYVDYIGADDKTHHIRITAPEERVLHNGMDPHFRDHIKIEPVSFLVSASRNRWTIETWTQ